MTLHEAIILVLKSAESGFNAREIAKRVNRQRLYKRGDGRPVPPAQISARINRYRGLFKTNYENSPHTYRIK